ncbi:MAG TPA: hypothetical protein VMU04_07745 [Candidatus Acidoferrum sp.]|nr:hypothetical protein [Candidatus Acidoferrum sp.]
MKTSDTPRTNRIGNMVAYLSPFGQCFRIYCVPKHPNSLAQARMKSIFGVASNSFGMELTEDQRERWVDAALTVPSYPSLGQYAHLSAQQFCVKINSTLQCVGQAPVSEPPAPVVFGPNPVGGLTITNDPQNGVRLLLDVATVTEDIMVFAQAPCSRGRMKHRRVCYLGLAGPATNGQCEVTAPYIARYGQPAPGQKVFVITNQHKNGWKGPDSVISAIVPPPALPAEQPKPATPKADPVPSPGGDASPRRPQPPEPGRLGAASLPISGSQQAVGKGASLLPRAMYKGSTPDAQAKHTWLARGHPLRIPCAPLVHSVRAAWARLRSLGMGYRPQPVE